ncbi:SRPBCC family protein [Mycobacterium sp.]|jgi:hypothetical protein|uniref:SRPBCC family protein n=1 Tax=Mycobacterium sp. TaxID=1785 RepID=UPI002D26F45A|nr:SRPBCC family protein [Mycobacterium sp.]HZA12218.1 SRPBCC family protein [Mycobacterium sp.]
MATADAEVHTVIARPRPVVAAYCCDPDNATEWYANIKEVQWETPKPVALGSRFAFTARFLGRTLRYTYEVVELVPERRFVMRTAQGPFPMETTYAWYDAPDGATRMTLRNRGEPAGFSRLAAPVMAPAIRRATTKDLARLKSILEAQR